MRKPSSFNNDKPGNKRTKGDTDKKPYRADSAPGRRSLGDAPRPGRSAGDAGRRPSFKKENDRGEGSRRGEGFEGGNSEKRPFEKREGRPADGGYKKFRSEGDKPAGKRPFEDRAKKSLDKPARRFENKEGSYDRQSDTDRPRKSAPYEDRRKPEQKGDDREHGKRPYPKAGFKGREEKSGDEEKRPFSRPKKEFDKQGGAEDRKPFSRPKKEFDKPGGFKKPFARKDKDSDTDRKRDSYNGRVKEPAAGTAKKRDSDSFDEKDEEPKVWMTTKRLKKKDAAQPKKEYKGDKPTIKRKRADERIEQEEEGDDLLMPLNKYIAYSGECSRRDAAEMVKLGKVKVNGELINDPGYKVTPSDKVTLSGKKLTPNRNMEYVLLNKPKGFITTTDDPKERKTVMDLVSNSGVERLYPVGRLDRNTTGLLLLTNDGELTQKLSHPSYNIKKVYQVTLDKQLTKAHFEQVVEGVQLEDGMAHVDELAYLETKSEVGLEIHSGRNRIVRRIFESLGYEVIKLDRVMYAGLTKKNLPRGKWRFLTPEEKILLKHFKS